MNAAAQLVAEDVQAVLAGTDGIARLKPLAGSHLFISGGTGNLGAWVLEFIAALNDRSGFQTRVTVLSRNPQAFQARFPHLGSRSEFHFQAGDIRSLNELPADTAYLLHAAALTDRRVIASTPTLAGEVNAFGTARLLRAATLLDDLRSLVVMSSGLVTGSHPFETPRIEEGSRGAAGPLQADAIYAESKRFSEILASAYASETKLPLVVLRPFTVVGPYQALDLPWAITDFIRATLHGEPIKIMGDGSTVRTLLYAADFAFWTLAALVGAKPRSLYNVGSDVPVDLLSLAGMVARHADPQVRILVHQGQSGHERSRLVPSIGKAAAELGLSITVPVEQAIARTIAWNRARQAS